MKRMLERLARAAACATLALAASASFAADALETLFRSPPPAARPHVYWLWLNGYMHEPSAMAELDAMRETGLGGVLLFDMGARGDRTTQPPAGPAFLSPPWLDQLAATLQRTKQLGLQVDMSVINSWDLGGPWIEPRHACMSLYSTEASAAGGQPLELQLPFPLPEKLAPRGADGRPAFWTDVAVVAARDVRRRAGHEIVVKLCPDGVHELRDVVLDNGTPKPGAEIASTLTPVRDFSIAVSRGGTSDADFKEVFRGSLRAEAGPQRFALPAGTQGSHIRLTLISGHDIQRPRWTLGEFEAHGANGANLALSRMAQRHLTGAALIRYPVPLAYNDWNPTNLHDGGADGPDEVYATAGLPPFDLPKSGELIDVTRHVDRDGRLRWNAPTGHWTFLRYTCMINGQKLKVPSPNSDGLATDHLNPEATRAHMDHVIARLREKFGRNLRDSGLTHLYLASYEIVGKTWSPVFAAEFERRRGYSLTRFLPALFGARIENEETTERFIFDFEKTLSEVLIDAYYRTAREVAHAAGLTIKSEAGGPGPPAQTPPVEALLANGAVDGIQGEFWPFWAGNDALWVVKETAAAGNIYGKGPIHMEAFTSFHHWAEGPQDLKPSADRVFCEGGNHMVWHTWPHHPPESGLPGWAYLAGTHINRMVPWWPHAKPFIDYLARCSALLQSGRTVADVLYYYGDGGYNFIRPRTAQPGLGAGYDYDVINADVLLGKLSVRDGRLVLPHGPSYAILKLPDRDDINPDVLAKIEALVKAGATVVGRKPRRASGLQGFPASDTKVREIAGRLWDTRNPRHVVADRPLRDILGQMKIAPDFVASHALDYIHRTTSAGEVYFVRNTRGEPVTERATFRVKGKAPELWDPRTGEITATTTFNATAAGTEVPLAFAPYASTFVIFRRAATAPSAAVGTRSALPAPFPLEGDWRVEFEPNRGAPATANFAQLQPWNAHTDSGIRHFSGKATYRKTFTVPAAWRSRGQRAALDLGKLWTIGAVTLNGKSLGVVWTAPFHVDCTEALREGENELVVTVANNWHNRIVGDSRLPAPHRVTRTNVQVTQHNRPWSEMSLIDSGLFGPVRLIATEQ